MINGIINVYKEKGYTSFDVIAKLRGILGQKKIGHTGTLDPDAEGVLPVCLGKATKVSDMLTNKDKKYRATMRLGIVTDTQDTSGKVLKESPVTVSTEAIRSAISEYIGDYHQIPPMYSAIKINGQKMYDLARKGIEVERKPRLVSIYAIDILRIEGNEITFDVTCSKGTYIRTLCHDIGEQLGCGACMSKLIRIQVGFFGIEDSLTLDEIRELKQSEKISDILFSIDQVFSQYPFVTVSELYNKALYNGNQLKTEFFIEEIEASSEPIRVYDQNKVFIGIYGYHNEDKVFKPIKMFL